MGTGMISTGLSGIQVAQLGLLTTEHNITNANTAGFNRQRTIQATNVAMLTGAGYVGQGAHVQTISRMYDSFLSTQVNRAQTTSSELQSYYTQIKQINNMLADANSGVSPALQEFFSGIQAVAANPSLLSARQSLVSTAQALVARYQGLEDRISQMYDGVNEQITTSVATINSYSTQIASLNEAIVVARSATNQEPNDLLDQRDQLVLDLNKLVRVTTTENSDGTFNVYVGNGQQLVVGSQVMKLTAQPSSADPSRFVVGLVNATGSQELPESLITGGSLGGLLSFRSGTLDRTANDLGRNAASLALVYNAQNALGQDLLGQSVVDVGFVADFFNEPSPKIVASSLNPAGSQTLPKDFVSYTPPSFDGNFYTDLTGSDYRLNFGASGLTLTRLSDNKAWTGANVAEINTKLDADPQGFELDDSVTFGPADIGASYLIQPTREAARNISVNATVAADVRLIAAAMPFRTAADSDNTGNGSITAGTTVPGFGTPPFPSAGVTLAYTATTKTLTLSSVPAVANISVTVGDSTMVYPGPTIPYTSGATISFAGTSFSISGSLNDSDSFSLTKNAAGVSDGRNALVLGQLQSQNTMSGATTSFQGAYAQLVSDVGNKSREIQVKTDAQAALLKQSTDARDSLSGVNLDEEAANLLRYQQAYQASAKMIEVGSRLFDVLLSAAGG